MRQIQYLVLMLPLDSAEQMRWLQVAGYLRNKYSDIEEMLHAAEMLSKEQRRASSRSKAPETDEYKLLKQDCYSIIWYVIKKKGIATKIESKYRI